MVHDVCVLMMLLVAFSVINIPELFQIVLLSQYLKANPQEYFVNMVCAVVILAIILVLRFNIHFVSWSQEWRGRLVVVEIPCVLCAQSLQIQLIVWYNHSDNHTFLVVIALILYAHNLYKYAQLSSCSRRRQVHPAPPEPEQIVPDFVVCVVDSNEEMCPVCLELLSSSEVVKLNACSHMFHSQCLLEWKGVKSNCPVCRHPLVPSLV